MATVVVLNGTSSSGKTTIARAFQEQAPSLFLNFSIDSILSTLPPSALQRIATGADIRDLRYPELARAFHACAQRLLELGHDLILDNAVTARYQAELLLQTVDGHRSLLVGVDCPREVLRERERIRGDRLHGLADLQCATIHSWLEYDLVLDSSVTTPSEAAALLVSALETADGAAAKRMRARVAPSPSRDAMPPSLLRLAEPSDAPALESLIARSGLELSAPWYTREQAQALTQHVFGVDSQLIADRTYFVIEDEGVIVACGGWSRRRTLFGGDQMKDGADPLLDPIVEPARIRAFFVDPLHARRGLGRRLMEACIEAARAAGFSSLELMSTSPGEPLYAASGFEVIERIELELPGAVKVPLARMRRSI